MSKHTKLERHPSMDPDIWEVYEETVDKWNTIVERRSDHLYDHYLSSVWQGKIEILERLLKKYIGAQYQREGEPQRVTMKDIIAYHEKLDRQYSSQSEA